MAGRIRYLKERNGRYSARLVVPRNLRSIVGNAELEIQLGPDKRSALKKLPAAVATLQERIFQAEKQQNHHSASVRYSMTTAEIASLNYSELLTSDTEMRESYPLYANIELDDGYVADLRKGMSGALHNDGLRDLVGFRIDRFRRCGNTEVDEGTHEWRKLAIALCASEYEALSRIVERDAGNFAGQPTHPLIVNYSPAEEPAPQISIRKLLESYLVELESNNRGREARKRWTPVFEDLVRFLGHEDANLLTKQNLLDWKDSKLRELTPKTVADVYLASIRAVLSWAAENERIKSNPAIGVRIKKVKPLRVRERGFREEEALAIVQACLRYTPLKRENPSNMESAHISAAKKWVALLCAFTGARVTEITQLRKVDVEDRLGIPLIRITPESGSVKTGMFREVPLHRQLVDLGFLDFVKASATGPLFHASASDKALKGARATSGRLSQWLQSLGIIPQGVAPNHGWRHRFKTIGVELGISDRILDAVQGHAARTAGDNYGEVTLKAKKRAIDSIPDFPFEG